MINELSLSRCQLQYNELKELKNVSPQERGRKFNDLITDVLIAHGIPAKANQRSIGEIDVIFRVNNKRYILEAKWEQDPIDFGPISKLGNRVRQRIQSNFGIFISMSGYTQDAIDQIAGRGAPNVILFGKEEFVALLYGVTPAEKFFEASLDCVSFEGKYHLELKDILKYLPFSFQLLDQREFDKGKNQIETELLKPINPNIRSKIIDFHLPFGQLGIATYNHQTVITLVDGIYYYQDDSVSKHFEIINAQNRSIPISKSETLCVINGSIVLISISGSITPVLPRKVGNVRLFTHKAQINVISNGTDFPDKFPVTVNFDIFGENKEIVFPFPVSSASDASIIDKSTLIIGGTNGVRLYMDTIEQWRVDCPNCAAVEYQNGRIYFLVNGTMLKSVDIKGRNIENHVEFGLPGSIGDFTFTDDKTVIFTLYYNFEKKPYAAIVKAIIE